MNEEFKNEEIMRIAFTSNAIANQTSEPGLTQTRVLEEVEQLAKERKLIGATITDQGNGVLSFSFSDVEELLEPGTGKPIYHTSTLIIDVDRKKCGDNNVNIERLQKIVQKTSVVKDCNVEALKKIGKFILIAGAAAIIVSKVVVPVMDALGEMYADEYRQQQERIDDFYAKPDGGDYREDIIDRMGKGKSY